MKKLIEQFIDSCMVAPMSKERIEESAYDIIENIKEGNDSPLNVAYVFTCLKQYIESIESDTEFKYALIEEAERYAPDERTINKTPYEVKEVGTNYDYKSSELYKALESKYNEKVEAFNEDTKEILKAIKSHKNLLKRATTSGTVKYAGRTFKFMPPKKTSTTKVSFNLPKTNG